MSLEAQLVNEKSLGAATGKTANLNEIAKNCIAFANAPGRRRILAERTVNVTVLPGVITVSNGGQYVELSILCHGRTATRTQPNSSHFHL